jgi:predicted nucleic acid-binding protein
MKLISNTSPIIFLSKLNSANLLVECFETVLVPESVKVELGNLTLPSGIQIQKVSPPGQQFIAGALGRLHRGELEAMVLAKETQADYVLLDDLLARRKAQRLGLQVMGTVGVILLAQRQHKINDKTAIVWLDQLTSRHGLYLSAEMITLIKT